MNIDNTIMDDKSWQFKIKNIMIIYNIITILKYIVFSYRVSILYVDFFIDFIIINIILWGILKIINFMNR